MPRRKKSTSDDDSCFNETTGSTGNGCKSASSQNSHLSAPTPMRKRGHEQSGDVPVVDLDGSDIEIVDIDVCGTARDRKRTRRSSMLAEIPCDACGMMVPFQDFPKHATLCSGVKRASTTASSNAVPCKVCSALVEPGELADHMAAHAVHEELLNADLQKSTSEVDVTIQVIDMARKGGTGLPGNGNQTSFNQGDPVTVRWTDGHWYQAHIVKTHPDGRHNVSWDPPYTNWDAQDVAADAVIPRMNHAREVSNFDVALSFVKKLKALKEKTHALEVVYHWTREENVNKIIENNLKTPGSSNADGSKVELKNGAVYGSGIYAAANINYGRGYGGGLSCAFLCLANPGCKKTCQKPDTLSKTDDSLQFGDLRVYKSSDQLLPLFFTDSKRSASLEKCTRDVASFLEEKVLGKSPIVPGTKVWALDGVQWYEAEVSKTDAPGGYEVKWLPPWDTWANQVIPAAHVSRFYK